MRELAGIGTRAVIEFSEPQTFARVENYGEYEGLKAKRRRSMKRPPGLADLQGWMPAAVRRQSTVGGARVDRGGDGWVCIAAERGVPMRPSCACGLPTDRCCAPWTGARDWIGRPAARWGVGQHVLSIPAPCASAITHNIPIVKI